MVNTQNNMCYHYKNSHINPQSQNLGQCRNYFTPPNIHYSNSCLSKHPRNGQQPPSLPITFFVLTNSVPHDFSLFAPRHAEPHRVIAN